jgi:hypothetical protein
MGISEDKEMSKNRIEITAPEEDLERSETPESRRAALIAKKRAERIPPGMKSLSLDYPQRPGFTRRVVCDRQGRLERFEAGGWDFVTHSTLYGENPADRKITAREGIDSRISQVVGKHKDNSPMIGYLMEIPTELYNEDQAMKMEQLDKLEAGFRQGIDPDGKGRPGSDGRYVPSTGIHIKRNQTAP